MKWNISVAEARKLGYQFVNSMNGKCYYKEVSPKCKRTIWLYERGKRIEIDTWQQSTDKILEFYKANMDKTDGNNQYGIKVQVNELTEDVQLYDYDMFYRAIKTSDWDEWNEKYSEYSEYYLSHESMKLTFKELEAIAKLDLVV